ncbi:hypothetical protein OF83DRAFT_940539 [Amylostereum chailletii]|nr:hypothetical protein OF83DRAFT_940539 [Amylostereum chailletii]
MGADGWSTLWSTLSEAQRLLSARSLLSSMGWSSLSPELVEHVLAYLGFHDLLLCQRLDRRLHHIVKHSLLLQYSIRLHAAALLYHLLPALSHNTADRLALLDSRERAWQHIAFLRSVHIPAHTTGVVIDGLVAGAIYAAPRPHSLPRSPDLAFASLSLSLPSAYTPDPHVFSWNPISLGIDLTVVNIGYSEDQDLIAVMTSRHERGATTAVLEFRLIRSSTGTPHPLAPAPVLFVGHCALDATEYSIALDIVGDNIVFLHIRHATPDGERDGLFFLPWKEGVIYPLRMSPPDVYTGFVFLSDNLLVLPNAARNHLEICVLARPNPNLPPVLRPIHYLYLPPLAPGVHIAYADMAAKPSPSASRGPSPLAAPYTPFTSDPSAAVIMIDFHLHRSDPDGLVSRSPCCVVHRHVLLSYALSSLQRSLHPQSNALDVPSTPWDDWGPHTTRWLDFPPEDARWATCAGQRLVSIAGAREAPLCVLDFNPYNVRRALAPLPHLRPDLPPDPVVLPNGNALRVIVRPSVVRAAEWYASDIVSALPYVETTTARTYVYDGISMDEERILGMRLHVPSIESVDDEVGIESYDVLVLGTSSTADS